MNMSAATLCGERFMSSRFLLKRDKISAYCNAEESDKNVVRHTYLSAYLSRLKLCFSFFVSDQRSDASVWRRQKKNIENC